MTNMIIDTSHMEIDIPAWPLHLPGLNEYQGAAARFAVYKDDMYPVFALGEEAGEVLGKYAKAIRAGVPVDKEAVKKELGDVLWNVAMIARSLDIYLEDVAQDNIAKLIDRWSRHKISGEGDYR